MTPCPATNTNEVAQKLREKIALGQSLVEFERAYFIRAAEQQESLELQYSILALTYTASGEREKAKDNALLAIDHMKDCATLSNALNVLYVNALNSCILDVLDRFVVKTYDPEILKILAPYFRALPNISHFNEIYDNLLKTKTEECAKAYFSMCKYSLHQAELAEDVFDIPPNTVEKITKFAAIIADKFGRGIDQTDYKISPSGDWMSLVYRVEKGEFDIVDLNMELADALIENEMDDIPLVARFDLPFASSEKIGERYAN